MRSWFHGVSYSWRSSFDGLGAALLSSACAFLLRRASFLVWRPGLNADAGDEKQAYCGALARARNSTMRISGLLINCEEGPRGSIGRNLVSEDRCAPRTTAR